MTEGTLPNPGDTSQGGDSTGQQPAEQRPATVEETEAFWRNRFSARDRAHNAEVAALKAQMEAMQKAPSKPSEGESAEAARIRELEQALEAERTRVKAAEVAGKYPLAASILGDDLARLTPEKVAAFNAALERGESPIIDPNAAGRRGALAAPKPDNEKTKEDWEAELRALTPAYQQMLKEK